MLALIAVGYSLICVLLLNAGWGKRDEKSWQRACVYVAGCMGGIAIFLGCALANLYALAYMAVFCALMFFGGRFDMSSRWMKRCTWALFLGYWVWSLGYLAWLAPQYAKWRQETPFESMEQRAAEPKKGYSVFTNSSDLPYNERYDSSDDQLQSSHRAKSIWLLHNSKLSEFHQAAGFGKIRMMLIHPLAEYFLPDVVQPIRQELDYVAELVSTGLNSSDIKTAAVAKMNDQSTWNFSNPAGFGLIESRSQVAGFRPHRFSKWPDGPQSWDVKRIDLVSLLLHDESVVYVSNDLPRMADVGKLATRELDTFEKDGLAAIRKGEDLYIRGDAEKVRVIGSMRNFDQCIKCHGGKDGDLLGAFSYVLVRHPTAK